MAAPDFIQQVQGIAALQEPLRQQLYQFVVSHGGDVSRDAAAKALGLTRALAGFHLDRLVEAGLLETRFQRLTGKSGPGAGRPAKLYRRAASELEVTLPPRSYELAASMLAAAVGSANDAHTRAALMDVARAVGRQIGEEAGAPKRRATSTSRSGRATTKRRRNDLVATLAARGYEPCEDNGEVRLRNCPFHRLAQTHRDLVCQMNLALIDGVVTACADAGAEAALDPKPGFCCVALRFARG